MGILKRGDVWYVKWKDATGKWRRKATTARSKADAQLHHAELTRQASRQRLGLDAQPLQTGMAFWNLTEWWLAEHVREASLRRLKSMMRVHVERSSLGALPLSAINAQVLNTYFKGMESPKVIDGRKRKAYSPRSINLLRANFGAIFEAAKRSHLWAGDNPAWLSEYREVIQQPRPTLTAAEVELVIENVAPSWRSFFATACYMGLRKGELCGLRKDAFDAVRRTLYVGTSYAAQQTKGKRWDTLPVPSALVPHLEAALKTPGPFMFPTPSGSMKTENAAPEDILKAAMRRARLIEGWVHKCRRCKKNGTTTHIKSPTDAPIDCPKPGCGMRMWASAVHRGGMKFHDMRHTVATLLLKSGIPIQHVQRIIRHASITTTVNTYGHLVTEDLRSALERMGPRPVQVIQLRAIPNQ